MSDNERHFDNDADLGLKPEFSEDLGRLFAPDRPIPACVDRAVAEAARQHFGRPRRRLWKRHWAVPATAAAAILLGVCLWWFTASPASHTEHDRRAQALAVAQPEADIDNNGKVDILDAFTLARHIESSLPTEATWDFNGDGLIDRRDVDTVALVAVRLDKGV